MWRKAIGGLGKRRLPFPGLSYHTTTRKKNRGNITAGQQPLMLLNHLRLNLGQMPGQSWTGPRANVLTADAVDVASRTSGNGLTTIATAYMVLCSVAATTYSYGCLGSAPEKPSSHTSATQQLRHALRVAAQSLMMITSSLPSQS
jgi:hypothetical protein